MQYLGAEWIAIQMHPQLQQRRSWGRVLKAASAMWKRMACLCNCKAFLTNGTIYTPDQCWCLLCFGGADAGSIAGGACCKVSQREICAQRLERIGKHAVGALSDRRAPGSVLRFVVICSAEQVKVKVAAEQVEGGDSFLNLLG